MCTFLEIVISLSFIRPSKLFRAPKVIYSFYKGHCVQSFRLCLAHLQWVGGNHIDCNDLHTHGRSACMPLCTH